MVQDLKLVREGGGVTGDPLDGCLTDLLPAYLGNAGNRIGRRSYPG